MIRLLTLVLAAIFLVPAPAQARDIVYGGSVRHGADAGYDPPILIHCQGDSTTRTRSVPELGHSDRICPSHNVDRVFVDTGEEIWCKVFTTYEKKWDATGWYRIRDVQNYTCVVHRD